MLKKNSTNGMMKLKNLYIDMLHIKYFYHGEYPRENVEEEFNEWYDEVKKFIDDLEFEAKMKK